MRRGSCRSWRRRRRTAPGPGWSGPVPRDRKRSSSAFLRSLISSTTATKYFGSPSGVRASDRVWRIHTSGPKSRCQRMSIAQLCSSPASSRRRFSWAISKSSGYIRCPAGWSIKSSRRWPTIWQNLWLTSSQQSSSPACARPTAASSKVAWKRCSLSRSASRHSFDFDRHRDLSGPQSQNSIVNQYRPLGIRNFMRSGGLHGHRDQDRLGKPFRQFSKAGGGQAVRIAQR